MRRIEKPADTGAIRAAAKALLLLSSPGCQVSPAVKERMERVAARNSSLTVAAADTSKVPGLAEALGVHNTPTVILFRRGQRISELTGRVSGQQLQDLVDSVLW